MISAELPNSNATSLETGAKLGSVKFGHIETNPAGLIESCTHNRFKFLTHTLHEWSFKMITVVEQSDVTFRSTNKFHVEKCLVIHTHLVSSLDRCLANQRAAAAITLGLK